ncbi:MAG: cupin domain-containing protein [Planctomycetaceae bacterium]|jgi:cupin 2 domain-containing protein|nr:cupin domain-containing protein [Planctomycetaceae bacterium]
MTESAKIKLNYINWQFFPSWMENFKKETGDGSFDGNWTRLIRQTEDSENKNALKRHQSFIVFALILAERLIEYPEVERIALFGSLAKPPVLEPYPYSKYLRNRGVHIFHSPKDIDLAIWLSSLDNLSTIRKTMSKIVGDMMEQTLGLSDDRVELFVFDHQSGKYLGRVCHFNRCPKGYNDCVHQRCGVPKHLKTMEGFVFHPEAISRVNSEVLFERTPTVELPEATLFAALPGNLPEELIEKLVDTPDVRIERIVSTGHASPPGFWYDQAENEWVVVLRGEAVLAFEDETRILKPGNYVLIPPHRKHRVHSTSLTEPTVWLAVFFDKEKKARSNRKNR